MIIYVDKKMMGRVNYPLLKEEFNEVEIVDNLENSSSIDAMVIMNSQLAKINIDDYPKLKWIQLLMAGYDNVDVTSIREKGILISNARDIFSIAIAEDVISKILFFNRNTKYYLESMKKKVWQPIQREPEIFNSTIAILGTGSIGKEVAKRLKSFQVKKIMGYRNKLEEVDGFDEVYNDQEGLMIMCKEADYLILALPLTESTKRIIDREKLRLMKKEALIINVARGDILDQDALIEALENEWIRGAGLDVTTPEPLPISSKLWTLSNVFITPHNASSSPYMQDRLYELTRENLRRFLNNQEVKYLLN